MSSERFEIIDTPLVGLKVVQRKLISDSRGFFCRFYCAEEFKSLNTNVLQINHSLTKQKGTIRGLHFQHPPQTETKIISCIKGEILDVAVDIRRGSPTFLQWHSEILSAANHRALYVDKGFAHGFQSLTDDAEVLYLVNEPYAPSAEDALNAMDPTLGIDWPLGVTKMSERDRNHRMLTSDFVGIELR